MKLPLLPEFITKRDSSKTYDEFVDSLSVFLNKPYIRAAPQSGKHIPRILWLAVKNSSEELPSHMLELFARNKDWQVNIVGNEDKDRFIDTVFSNTRYITHSSTLFLLLTHSTNQCPSSLSLNLASSWSSKSRYLALCRVVVVWRSVFGL